MRTTLKDLPKAITDWGWRDALVGWWIELPRYWRYRWWWRNLWFEPGQGWLRWGYDKRYTGGWHEASEVFCVAPPLRRLWDATRFRDTRFLSDLKDPERLS